MLMFTLASQAMARGEVDRVLAEMDEVLARHPEAGMAWQIKCQALQGRGATAEALLAAVQAVTLMPADGLAQYMAGAMYLKQQQLEQALPHLREAVRLMPARPDFHHGLAVALFQKQDYAEAEAEFREVLRLAPGHAEARKALGVLTARRAAGGS
jgi:Flp pilus assembly protein TadD